MAENISSNIQYPSNSSSGPIKLHLSVKKKAKVEEVFKGYVGEFEEWEIDGFIFHKKRQGAPAAPPTGPELQSAQPEPQQYRQPPQAVATCQPPPQEFELLVLSDQPAPPQRSAQTGTDAAMEAAQAEPAEVQSVAGEAASGQPTPLQPPAMQSAAAESVPEQPTPLKPTTAVPTDGDDAATGPSTDALAVERSDAASCAQQQQQLAASSPGTLVEGPLQSIKQPLTPVSEETVTDLLAALPEGVPEAERLQALCKLVCEQQVSSTAAEHGPDAADAAAGLLERFLANLSGAVAGGGVRLGDDAAAERGRLMAAEQRRAALQDLLAQIEKETADWQRVAEQHQHWAQQLAASEPAAPTAEAEAAAAARRVAAEPAEQAGEAQLAELRKERDDAYRRHELQVAGLCALVSGVEELVAKAEHSCSIMQADYHRQKFRQFPHVDSPVHLVRELMKPRLYDTPM